MVDNTSNQLSKFRTKNWVEINDESPQIYDANNDIKFKTSMIRSRLCGYSDAYIHVKETITILKMVFTGVAANIINKKVTFMHK